MALAASAACCAALLMCVAVAAPAMHPGLLNVTRVIHRHRFAGRAAPQWPDGDASPADAPQLFAEAFAFEAADDGSLRAAAARAKAALWEHASGLEWHLGGPVGAAPQQVHVAPTAAASNMSVLWLTDAATTASRVCWRAAAAGAAVRCEAGSSWTYDPISVIPWAGRVHGAFLLGLAPGAAYEYRVGDGRNATSRWFPLTVSDREADDAYVALGGDMGSVQLFGWTVAEQMLRVYHAGARKFDAFWHLGDITYSTVSPPHYNFEFFADAYGQQEEALAARVPLLATYGNHDVSGGDCGAFIHRYRNPRPAPADGPFNFYWSYRQGPVWYVSICTETHDNYNHSLCDLRRGSAQHRWLEAELAGVNRSATPWVVVAGHRPMYSTDTEHHSSLHATVEPLFLQYGVDAYIAGHMHETAVTAPMKNFTAEGMDRVHVAVAGGATEITVTRAPAPVHVTVGALGAVQAEFFTPRPAWLLFRNGTIADDAYGFATLAASRTALDFTFLRQRTGKVLWSLHLEK
jgi:hypothetical protein